ncbi:hypothetical protein Tco_1105242 [Tanacetum coccineum]
MEETMKEYMSKTRVDYGSGVTRPKIDEKYHFELKGQFLKELRNNTFSDSDYEDANEHIEKVLEIVDLFQEVILFYNWLEVPTRQILDSKGAISTKTTVDAKAAIQAQLNNLGREIKKVNEKVYVAQVGCELCKGPHYTKDCPLKEKGKTLKEAYYTQFGVPFQQRGQYRAAAPRFYQRNNANPSYQERRQSMEESLRMFMNESAKRHKENSNLIKEIRASTDAAIKNQGASIKTLEIQIEQMSKNRKLIFKSRQMTIPFPSHLDNYYCDEKGSCRPQYLDTCSYGATRLNDALPRKEKDPGSFTLPYYINNVCFENALADLGASIENVPFKAPTRFYVLTPECMLFVNDKVWVSLVAITLWYCVVQKKSSKIIQKGIYKLSHPPTARGFCLGGRVAQRGRVVTKQRFAYQRFEQVASCSRGELLLSSGLLTSGLNRWRVAQEASCFILSSELLTTSCFQAFGGTDSVLLGKDKWREYYKSIKEGKRKMVVERYGLPFHMVNGLMLLPRNLDGSSSTSDNSRVLNDLSAEEKDIWENIEDDSGSSELTKDDRESHLYDEYEHFLTFRQNKEETIRIQRLSSSIENLIDSFSIQHTKESVPSSLNRTNHIFFLKLINATKLRLMQGTKAMVPRRDVVFKMSRGRYNALIKKTISKNNARGNGLRDIARECPRCQSDFKIIRLLQDKMHNATHESGAYLDEEQSYVSCRGTRLPR